MQIGQSKYIIFIGLTIAVILLLLHSYLDKRINCFSRDIKLQYKFEENESALKRQNISIDKARPEMLTSLQSYDGESSIRISEENTFYSLAHISNPEKDRYYCITLKTKNADKVLLVAQGDVSKSLYKTSKIIGNENGWDIIQTEFYVPPGPDINKIKLYLWNIGNETFFADELEIVSGSQKDYPVLDNENTLRIFINEEPFQRLKTYRTLAFESKQITDECKQEVPALIYADNRMMEAEIRLKGDWLDHLDGDKWSFRIKLTEDSWHGMREFSIQAPVTRDFLKEWLIHKIAIDEGLLTTRYGFTGVRINGQSRGIYAYEEHFEKQLIESQKHREGPILKFDESEFWQNMFRSLDAEYAYQTSEIIPFSGKKTIKDSTLYRHFLAGQNMLDAFRWHSEPAGNIFDVNKTAGSFALMDCLLGQHGLRWHNQRFYFNPVTYSLQPIIFDCYVYKAKQTPDNPIMGFTGNTSMNPATKRYFNLFNDTVFSSAYYRAIKKFSDPGFLEYYKSKYKHELDSLEKILSLEYKWYTYETSDIEQRMSQVNKQIPYFHSLCYTDSVPAVIRQLKEQGGKPEGSARTLLKCELNAYKDGENVVILSTSDKPFNITGLGSKKKKKESFTYSGDKFIESEIYKTFKIHNPHQYKYLYFTNDSSHEDKVIIHPFPAPGSGNARTDFTEKNLIDTCYLKGGVYVFDEGEYHFSQPLVIPASSSLTIKAGATLEFSNSAGILSYSPVQILGTAEKAVTIKSTDTCSAYLTVISAGKPSLVEYCQFEGQNTFKYKGWQLTGGVTFYESDVIIRNSSFANNLCEDALNIIRSHFDVSGSSFINTFADGFDSDFCTGNLSYGRFEYTGNDAIDFSGSVINIENCRMNNIGDKAVSGGEHSTLTLNELTIDHAVTGIASKDLSVIKGKNIRIKNVDYGTLLLQKKPEYGPATLILDNSSIENAKHNYLVETGSVFQWNGEKTEGDKQNLNTIFY